MPDGTTYHYAYDDNDRLTHLIIPGVGDIEYPSYTMNRPDSVTFPGGSSQSYQYDALLRLEQITASTLSYAYSYDNVSNILTKQTEHGSYTYGYDEVSRLLTADNPVLADETYTYDGVGNRETASGVTGDITHNANNELTIYGEISYDYDTNGNLIRRSIGTAAVNYIYDAANRLVKVEDDVTQAVIAEYDYDPFGRRLWKEVGGTRTYFLYADEGLVAEYDSTGNEIRSYGYKPDSTWTTDPLWQKVGSMYYWYQNDHLGTPQKLVDSVGMVVWSAQDSAFGEAEVQVETVTNNLRFPGQYEDVETGLYYNYFRYYDPRIGRYLRVDPIGFAGRDENLYVYVWNNPGNWVDPHGLYVQLIYDIETHTLIVYEVIQGKRVGDTIKTDEVFSGNDNPNDQHVEDVGPVPKGKYMVGKGKVKKDCSDPHPAGNCVWYPLLGEDGMEGWTHYGIPVKDPKTGKAYDPETGKKYYRGGMYLHVGRVSTGCLTVNSEVGSNDSTYPQSKIFDEIQKLLDHTTTHLPCKDGTDDTCPGYLIVQ